MKKANGLILILALVGGGSLLSCSKQPIKNTLGTSIDSISSVSASTPASNAFSSLNKEELLFDAVHYALGSKTASNGSVTAITAKKGGLDMNYAGVQNPTITGIPPTLIDTGKWLMFDNRPSTNYNSAAFTPVKAPYEIWLISRNMPGQRFEAKMQGSPVSAYLGDNDGGGIRAVFNNVTIPNSSLSPNYQVVIERMVIKPNSVDYYQNGKFIGSSDLSAGGANTAKSILDNTTRSIHSIGTYTNSMDFDFGALYFKAGGFSDGDATTVYNSLAAKWNAGSTPDQILLSNIKWTNVNGTYTPSATVIHTPEGVTLADPSKWKYQWYWKDNETNYATQAQFSTNMVVHSGDFPSDDGSHTAVCIKVRVMPVDVNGKGWRYLSGTFGEYTQGAQ
jgi:hypothetical protein